MSIYTTDIAPPQSYLAVEAIHTLLAGSASVVSEDWIPTASEVYLHQHDENYGDRCLVVREEEQLGGKFLSSDKREHVGVQVMAMINPKLETGQHDEYAHRWLYSLHKRVHDVITGQTLTLDPDDNLPGDHTVALPVGIYSQNSTPALDQDLNRWFSTATYIVTMNAVS